MVLEAALAVFLPREPMRSFDWARQFAADEWGQPYDDHSYPHLGAPGGSLDALDCRKYLEIVKQWGTRLGKSFTGQVGTLKNADCEPSPMLFAAADRPLALQIAGRTRKMLGHIPHLAAQLAGGRENKLQIDFQFCRLNIGWPRSAASLADKEVRFGHAAEIEKWVHLSTSKEADPLELWDERFKNKPTYKNIKEGSPGLKASSRIEPLRLRGTNAQLYVPCKKCRRYQPLVKEQVLFDKPAAGRPDPDLARASARYQCPHCKAEHGDEDRGAMMRAGVWVPEGCGVNHKKAAAAAKRTREPGRELWRGFSEDADWLVGKPVRDGHIYSSQLSSLYALAVTWGQVAEKIVLSDLHPETRRNFTNSWLGETFEFVRREQTWETLGTRLMDPFDLRRGIVPPGYKLLTAGIDKQETHYVIDVEAWASGRTSHTIDYYEADDEDELLQLLADEYETAAGGKLRIGLSLLDSGFRPKDVYALVERAKKRGLRILPCRGSPKPLGVGLFYRKKRLGKDTAKEGAPYVLVDGNTTQDWLDRQLFEIEPGDRGGATLFRAELAEQQDYLEQLLNEAPDKAGVWHPVDESEPWDYRDAKRYAFVAMLLRTRGKDIRAGKEPGVRSRATGADGNAVPGVFQETKQPPRQRKPSRTQPLRRPGGWLNMP